MKKEIVELRKLMHDNGIDVYYVPSGDYHNSEYVNDYFKTREFLSGLTGESGSLLVNDDGAWLWTDGRFFLQAEHQLAGSEIELMKMGEEGVPTLEDFLTDLAGKYRDQHPDKEFVIGFDGRVVPVGFGRALKERFDGEEWNVAFRTDVDLAGDLWTARPALKPSKIWDFPIESAGVDSIDKITAVRKEMAAEGVDHLLITDLMDTAWLLNLRGADIAYTPIFYSFTLLSQDSISLYVMDGALENGLPERLSFVTVKDYSDVYKDVSALDASGKIWFDPASCNFELYCCIPEGMARHESLSPIALMKMIKNDTEIACTKNAHVKDGIAVTKCIKWLKETVGKEYIDEIGLADKLESLRREQEGCFDLSFETIPGYGPNGAIIHYAPTPETNIEIKPEGFLLLDSGGQYIDGTTDITRTIAVGPLSQKMIDYYTLVLKGHIAIATFKAGKETNPTELDTASRAALREHGLEFNHGVAHGVGHVLGVHEGPGVIRRGVDSPYKLKAGMVTSNEPGVYIDGEFGVRIENVILYKEDADGYIINEPLTCVPYERRAINKNMLSAEETAWINDYHKWVCDTLTPLVDEETAEFIRQETMPL